MLHFGFGSTFFFFFFTFLLFGAGVNPGPQTCYAHVLPLSYILSLWFNFVSWMFSNKSRKNILMDFLVDVTQL